MRSAILNVSLDEKVCANASAQHRFNMVMRCLKMCFHGRVVGEIKTVQYEGPDGLVREDCAVATIDIDGASVMVVEDALRLIASNLGQDCIAVLYDDGTGRCVGPRADRWPFDIKHFNLPASAELRTEAA